MESSAIKFCAHHKVRKSQTHRMEARRVFILLIKKKRKGKKLVSKTKRHGVIHGKFPLCPFRSTCKNLCQALIFVSLNRKNITSTPPCNCALKNLILALRDSAEALVA